MSLPEPCSGIPSDPQLRLDRDGIILFEELTSEEFVELFRTVADPIGHRDSGENLITRISPVHPDAGKPGYDGFTRKGLPPHIDGSGLHRPPEVLGTYCARPASRGGEALLVDGEDVIRALSSEPEVLADLLTPASCTFGRPGVDASILELRDDRYLLRYRDDRLIARRLRPGTIETLRRVIAELTAVVPLGEGSGYIAHNRAYLHGRTAFTGGREVRRLLGNSRQLAHLAG